MNLSSHNYKSLVRLNAAFYVRGLWQLQANANLKEKKNSRVEIGFVQTDKVAIFSHKNIPPERTNQPDDGRDSNPLKHCQMTQHPPPWTSHCGSCWKRSVCMERSSCPRAAIWFSSSCQSHQLLQQRTDAVSLSTSAFALKCRSGGLAKTRRWDSAEKSNSWLYTANSWCRLIKSDWLRADWEGPITDKAARPWGQTLPDTANIWSLMRDGCRIREVWHLLRFNF